MFITKLIALFINPSLWKQVHDNNMTIIKFYLRVVLWITLLPIACTLWGVTVNGWSIPGFDRLITIDVTVATILAFASWVAINLAIMVISFFTCWMSANFSAKLTLTDSLIFSTYALSPFFILGSCGLFPSLWLAIIAIFIAIFLSCYLLYTGIAYFMEINPEKGFLYASSILCVALITLVGMMAATIVIWGSGIEPMFNSFK